MVVCKVDRVLTKEGPLEKLWGLGAGKVQKKKFMQGKIK